jgi:predicted enzyme related to lactoylglutathione lyase
MDIAFRTTRSVWSASGSPALLIIQESATNAAALSTTESGSKLHGLQTLRAVSSRQSPRHGFYAAGRLHSVAAIATVSLLLPLALQAQPPLPPLTTVSDSPRLPGKFVWADLVTDNVLGARKFYARMFGWTFQDMGNYIIAANDDRPLCGMFQRPRPEADPNAKPRWFGYISVPNVERAQRAVTKAGGRVLAAAKEFPKRGEQAIFADLEGAVFGVIKSDAGDPEDFMAEPGDWIWVQLLSHDAKKASEFYRAVAGYDVIENTSSNRLSDYVLASEGFARATVRTIPTAHTDVKPTWLPFVRVRNLGESVALAKQIGGGVLIEPRPELLGGKVAVVADPTGAAIGILEWEKGLLKGGR